MKGFIYIIKNKLNGKFYLGSTIDTNKRKNKHFNELRKNKHHCIHLQRAFNKYGEEAFEFEIVEEVESCAVSEQALLDELDWSNTYNVNKNYGGGDIISYHPNKEDIRSKISSTLKRLHKEGKVVYPDRTGDKNSNWRGGTTFCDCGARINSNNKTCMKCNDKTGSNNPFYNKQHSDETKQKISAARKGKYEGAQEKAVIVNGIEYKSVSDAARNIKVCAATIINRIRNPKFKEYEYKDNL